MVIVDTAGRLQNKAGLMDELGKVKRVVEKQAPVTEVLLVLDATTGQNGLMQARVFREVVDVTGIVLTKLDGSAKGGIVVAVQRELGVPGQARRPRRGRRRPGAVRPRGVRRRPARRRQAEPIPRRRAQRGDAVQHELDELSSSSTAGIGRCVIARIARRPPSHWTAASTSMSGRTSPRAIARSNIPVRQLLGPVAGGAVERGDPLVAHRLLDRGPEVGRARSGCSRTSSTAGYSRAGRSRIEPVSGSGISSR